MSLVITSRGPQWLTGTALFVPWKLNVDVTGKWPTTTTEIDFLREMNLLHV